MEVIEGSTIPSLRVRVGAPHHFWQGRPGLWRSLIMNSAAEQIASVHHAYCAEFGYSCASDPALSAAQVDANWLALSLAPGCRETTRNVRQIRRLKGEYAAAQDRLRGLGPTSLAMARGFVRLSRCFPGLSYTLKKLLRLGMPIVPAHEPPLGSRIRFREQPLAHAYIGQMPTGLRSNPLAN